MTAKLVRTWLQFPRDGRWTPEMLAGGIRVLIGGTICRTGTRILIGTAGGSYVAEVFKNDGDIFVEIDAQKATPELLQTVNAWHDKLPKRKNRNAK